MGAPQIARSYVDAAESGIARCRAALKKTSPRPPLELVPTATEDDEDLSTPRHRRDIDG